MGCPLNSGTGTATAVVEGRISTTNTGLQYPNASWHAFPLLFLALDMPCSYPCIALWCGAECVSDCPSLVAGGCRCDAGYTISTSTNVAVPTRVRVFRDKYLYKMIFYSTASGGTVSTEYGGPGGTPEDFSFATGEYIVQAEYRRFQGDWDSYLGCGVMLYTNLGNVLDFRGTYYYNVNEQGTASTDCAATSTFFRPPSGQVVTGLTQDLGTQNAADISFPAALPISGFLTDTESTCGACALGTYKADIGNAVCTVCAAGLSTVATASTADTNCVCGLINTISAALCTCNAGFYQLDNTCTPCPIGSYKAANGTGTCTTCANFQTTAIAGGATAADCVCMVGYYLNAGTCEVCPTGLHC